MRAGCFAEPRVIDLLNRRFVSFYYNTDAGPPQPNFKGKDANAKAFLKDKTQNKYAFYAAFTAAGEPVGVTDVYANKDVVFDFLMALLKENPEFDRFTDAENATLARAQATPSDFQAALEAGKLLEELGRYQDACPFLERVCRQSRDQQQQAASYRGLLRMARYERKWQALDDLCKQVENLPNSLGMQADIAAERSYHLKAAKQYEAMLKLTEQAIRQSPKTRRLSELHFQAGVACFFLDDKPAAYYHWCWVVENLPDDHLARRCYLAAAHEGMPYKNPELDNYAAPLHGGRTEVIQAAYNYAKSVYLERKSKE